MKIINSNKSYYIIIAGILAISILAIFMAFALGVRGYRVYEPNATNPHSIGFQDVNKDVSESKYSENNKNVSVAQGKCIDNVDTEKGAITIEGENLPDWDVLPLCITQKDLDGHYVLVRSCGGYSPKNIATDWEITLYQDTDNKKWTKELIGTIKLVPTEVYLPSTCCCKYYNITFVVDGSIHIDSNKFPDVPAGWNLDKCTCHNDLDKKVKIDIETKWKGCDAPCQSFEIILTQKILFSGSPTPKRIF